MNNNLYSIVRFKYNDSDRQMFVTEENERYIAGYQLTNNDVQKYFKNLSEAFNSEDEKIIKEEIVKFSSYLQFKKYLKEKIERWYD